MKKLILSAMALTMVTAPTMVFAEGSEAAQEETEKVETVKGKAAVNNDAGVGMDDSSTEVEIGSKQEGVAEEPEESAEEESAQENGVVEPTASVQISNVDVVDNGQGDVLLNDDVELKDAKEPINPMSYVWAGLLVVIVSALLWGYKKK